MDIWVFTTFSLSSIALLQTFMFRYLCQHIFSFLLCMSGIAGSYGKFILNFSRNCQTVFQVTAPFYTFFTFLPTLICAFLVSVCPLCSLFLFSFSFFFKYIYLFIFGCVRSLLLCAGFSLVVASGGYSSLRCAGFSLWWLLLLQSTGFRRSGFSSVALALSSFGAWA